MTVLTEEQKKFFAEANWNSLSIENLSISKFYNTITDEPYYIVKCDSTQATVTGPLAKEWALLLAYANFT